MKGIERTNETQVVELARKNNIFFFQLKNYIEFFMFVSCNANPIKSVLCKRMPCIFRVVYIKTQENEKITNL